jgi:hypothetical protein
MHLHEDLPASSDFSRIIKNSKVRLGAVANLGLGAAAIPEGLVIVSSDYVFLPMILEIVPPQWAPVDLRHPAYKKECQYLRTTSLYMRCLSLIEDEYQRQACSTTIYLQAEFAAIVRTFQERYDGATNPAFYTNLMDTFCASNTGLCTEASEKKRSKRMVAAALMGISGIAGLAIGISNAREITKLNGQMKKLGARMEKNSKAIQALSEGIQILQEEDEKIMHYVTENLQTVYRTIEHFRCENRKFSDQLTWWMGLSTLRQYLEKQLDAIFEASTTGRLTPSIIGAADLRKVLGSHPALKNTLSHRELSYVYQYATVYPVKMDFRGLQFGYILQVPNPKPSDIYPLYQIYNIGFHRANEPTEEPGYNFLVYKAPLPRYAVLTIQGQLVPLQVEGCKVVPGIMSCQVGAVARTKIKHPCLEMFTNKKCDDCPQRAQCLREVSIDIHEGKSARVVTTPAGALIRSQKDVVRVYQTEPHRSPGNPGSIVPPTQFGTYWLPHAAYKFFAVGNAMYATQGQTVHVTRVVQPPPFNFTEIFHDFSDFAKQRIVTMQYHANRLDQKLAKVKDFMNKGTISEPEGIMAVDPDVRYGSIYAILIMTVIALAILVAYYCCSYRRVILKSFRNFYEHIDVTQKTQSDMWEKIENTGNTPAVQDGSATYQSLRRLRLRRLQSLAKQRSFRLWSGHTRPKIGILPNTGNPREALPRLFGWTLLHGKRKEKSGNGPLFRKQRISAEDPKRTLRNNNGHAQSPLHNCNRRETRLQTDLLLRNRRRPKATPRLRSTKNKHHPE